MTQRQQLVPDASHPITVTPTAGRVLVTVGDQVVAETTRSLTLQEASYPPVQYVPLADVDPVLLARTDHSTYCPFKGEAAYYDLAVDGQTLTNAVWTYDAPYDAVASIAGHVAFYPDRVSVELSS